MALQLTTWVTLLSCPADLFTPQLDQISNTGMLNSAPRPVATYKIVIAINLWQEGFFLLDFLQYAAISL
jgi:hypothetical protein